MSYPTLTDIMFVMQNVDDISFRLTTFALIWFDYYNESPGIGGLNYISLGLGFIIGTQICAPLNDRVSNFRL